MDGFLRIFSTMKSVNLDKIYYLQLLSTGGSKIPIFSALRKEKANCL